eukprot:8922875-Pyramimonas_sp.AAC.1
MEDKFASRKADVEMWGQDKRCSDFQMAIRLMSYKVIVMLSHVRERAKQYRDLSQGARQKGSKSHPAWMITLYDLID